MWVLFLFSLDTSFDGDCSGSNQLTAIFGNKLFLEHAPVGRKMIYRKWPTSSNLSHVSLASLNYHPLIWIKS